MNSFDINKFLSDINKKYLGKKIFLFAMGMLVSAISFNLFFQNYNIIPTGSSGFSLLLSKYIPVDISLIMFVVSLGLLLLGVIVFGIDYGFKMLAAVFIYPAFVSSTTLITRHIDLEGTSLFLIMVLGGAMLGFGTALVRKSGYNPGGFSVLYDTLYKFFHISIGTSSIIVNSILIICSGFVYGFENAVYAIISLLVSSYIVDKFIIGISDNKVFYIITDRPLDVRDYVINKLHYSVTIVNGRGGYTNKKKKMLMCVVPTREYVKLKEIISEIDKNAFFLIVDIYDSNVKENCKYM